MGGGACSDVRFVFNASGAEAQQLITTNIAGTGPPRLSRCAECRESVYTNTVRLPSGRRAVENRGPALAQREPIKPSLTVAGLTATIGQGASASQRKRSEILVSGDYPLTRENFDHIANALVAYSGIHMHEAKAALVHSRLAKRLRKLGCASFDDYCAFVETEQGASERSQMFAALTTNFTSFFREPHHFDHLREKVLPPLIESAKAGGRVRIWSSACSTGEEPYSIALTLLDLFPEAKRYDLRILATDIDPNVVATARAGVYREETVAAAPKPLRDRWMARTADGDARWRVRDEVREIIRFNELNLVGSWPMRGQFDVIFCRNVVIYFEQETQTRLWERFHQHLTPAGRLYIGHSERVDSAGFVSDGLTIYRRAGGG